MDLQTALFLSVSAVALSIFMIVVVVYAHRQKSQELELEALKIREANLQQDVEEEVARQMKEVTTRIEVLEAIVTDKKYELSDKITQLK